MRFIVDEMPTSANCDCPFAKWKPFTPCFEGTGEYICKNDDRKCDREETECRWMVQIKKPPKER